MIVFCVFRIFKFYNEEFEHLEAIFEDEDRAKEYIRLSPQKQHLHYEMWNVQ